MKMPENKKINIFKRVAPVHIAQTTILGLWVGFSWPVSSWSAEPSASGAVPVSTVVSVEARHGKISPSCNAGDVRVFEGNNRLQVTGWVPAQGDQSPLELFVLIDDAPTRVSLPSLGTYATLWTRSHRRPQLPVGYLRNGTVQTVQNFTKDRAEAGKALRIPLGSGAGRKQSITWRSRMKLNDGRKALLDMRSFDLGWYRPVTARHNGFVSGRSRFTRATKRNSGQRNLRLHTPDISAIVSGESIRDKATCRAC